QKYFGNYLCVASFRFIFAPKFRPQICEIDNEPNAMREKIIKKAGELFLKVGFKSITMDDIAREMGISKKTIYKHFENKELLIEATTEVVHTEVHQAIDEIMSKNHNAIAENFEIKSML